MASPASRVRQFGLTPVYTSPDPQVDIVFVHGLIGHPYSTWATDPHNAQNLSSVYWPTDLLPEALASSRVRILTYGYNADVASFTDSVSNNHIHHHAETLASILAANRSLQDCLDRPIIFVCHSLGGLVVKRALIYCKNTQNERTEHLRSIWVSTYGILFLGTPHTGSDVAKWRLLLQNICAALMPKQVFRERLRVDFGYTEMEIEDIINNKHKKDKKEEKGKKGDKKEKKEEKRDEDPNKPTWIKVHRKHLLPDTLITYQLPWSWDEYDGNYMLIKTWISEELQEELFAHSRRLREGKVISEKPNTLTELRVNDRNKDSSSTLIESPQTNNETLQNINSLFSRDMGRFRIYCFHETLETDVNGSREFIVDEASAAPPAEGVERMGIEADHRHMCKFDNDSSPGYEAVAEALLRYSHYAPDTIAARWAEENKTRPLMKKEKASEIFALNANEVAEREAVSANSSPNLITPNFPGSVPAPGRTHFLPSELEMSPGDRLEIIASPDAPPTLLIAPPGFHPNATFYGMQKELEILHNRLYKARKRHNRLMAVLISGVPGSGKTHLAREYVWNSRECYPGGVFWINAKSTKSILKCFWDIAQEAMLIESPDYDRLDSTNSQKIVGVVRNWFQSREGWLIVFDGLFFSQDEDISTFRQFLPFKEKCSIIYTSVDRTLRKKQRLYEPYCLRTSPLQEEDARKLLFKDLGIRSPNQQQIRKATEIVKHYECLPLAIHAIGHRLCSTGKPLEKYYIQSHLQDKNLSEPFLSIMHDLYRMAHFKALNLINLLSFFDHHVPVRLIELGRSSLEQRNVDILTSPRPGERGDIDTTLGILIRYGLIERTFDAYTLQGTDFPPRSEKDNLLDMKAGSPNSSEWQTESSPGALRPTHNDSGSVDIVKIHSVVQGFCQAELKTMNGEMGTPRAADSEDSANSYHSWLVAATLVFCTSYENMKKKMNDDDDYGLVKDLREYEIHASRLASCFPKPTHESATVRQAVEELRQARRSISTDIRRIPTSSSPESARRHRSVFGRSSSSLSLPESAPDDDPSRQLTWDLNEITHKAKSPQEMPNLPHNFNLGPFVFHESPSSGAEKEEIGYETGGESDKTFPRISPVPSYTSSKVEQLKSSRASSPHQTDEQGWHVVQKPYRAKENKQKQGKQRWKLPGNIRSPRLAEPALKVATAQGRGASSGTLEQQSGRESLSASEALAAINNANPSQPQGHLAKMAAGRQDRTVDRDDLLEKLQTIGYDIEEINNLLAESERDSPWIYFEPTVISPPAMGVNIHINQCSHRLRVTRDHIFTRPSRILSPRVGLGADDREDIIKLVEELCGIGGICPNTRILSDWVGTAKFSHEANAIAVEYALPTVSKRVSLTKVDVSGVCRALDNVRFAAGYLQENSLCCQSFTVVKYRKCEGNADSGDIVSVDFQLVANLTAALENVKNTETLLATSNLFEESLAILKLVLPEESRYEDYELDADSCLHFGALAVQFLCLGLLSYIQAHIGPIQPFFLDTPIHRATLLGTGHHRPYPHLMAKLVNLSCLSEMTRGPVWMFSNGEEEYASDTRTSERCDIVGHIDDIIDTWGPGNLIYRSDNPGFPVAVQIGGGFIFAGEESTYHWAREIDESAILREINPLQPIRVGALTSINADCRLDEEACRRQSANVLEYLGTSTASWVKSQRQIGLQGGQYVVGQFIDTWNKQRGVSVKEVALAKLPDGLMQYMDEYWGVQVSYCTGVARRVLLRTLISDLLRTFPGGTEPEVQQFEAALRSSPCQLDDFLRSISPDSRQRIMHIVHTILDSLQYTGLDSTGRYFCIAWPFRGEISRCFKVPLEGQSSWARILADSHDTATFAYITMDCLETDIVKCRELRCDDMYLLETAVTRTVREDQGEWTMKDEEVYYFSKLDSIIWVKVQRHCDNQPANLIELMSMESLTRGIRQRLYMSEKRKQRSRLRECPTAWTDGEPVSVSSTRRNP